MPHRDPAGEALSFSFVRSISDITKKADHLSVIGFLSGCGGRT